MTKDREIATKPKQNKKKQDSHSTPSFVEFLKNQSDIVSSLRTHLQKTLAEKQQIQFAAMERDKCIQELQKSIENRDAEIKKLESEFSSAQEENTKTMQNFYVFKEKYFQLETQYDIEHNRQNQNIDNLKQQLSAKDSQELEQARQLQTHCEELTQQLQGQKQAYSKLVLDYAELNDQLEKNQYEFLRLQKSFENFKKQEKENSEYNKKLNNDLNALKQDLLQKQEHFSRERERLSTEVLEKDELIKQLINDKDVVENEKNCTIQELNHKIKQIEKVFGQPTKSVPPILTIPNTPQTPESDHQAIKTANNVAITKPQLRQEDRNKDASTIIVEDNQHTTSFAVRARSTKRPRPINTTITKKRGNVNGNQLLKKPSSPVRNRSTISTPSTEDDGDNEICLAQWEPNHYVPETETDASECLFKPKRIKK